MLRHRPGSIGIALDEAGWVDVEDLLSAMAAHGTPVTRAQLKQVVATNDTQRFAFDETGSRIGASQGHSVAVELGYAPRSRRTSSSTARARRLFRRSSPEG